MAHVIIAPDAELTLAPNDCGCSEHRGAYRQAASPFAVNDCRADLGGQPGGAPLPAPLERLRPHPLLRRLPLDADHEAAFVPSASQIAVLDAAAGRLLRRLPLGPAPTDTDLRAVAALARAGLLVADARAAIPPPPPPTTLVAWMHITNACNLRCSYCYIGKSGDAMSEETARAAVDMLIDSALRHGFPALLIKYAGGEPTLQLPLIAATHRYAQRRAAAHGIALHGGVLSNGTLISPPAARALRDLGLRLMISLDGPAEVHDAQRPTAGGRPSFAAVAAGIANATEAGLQPTIGVTVTGRSVAGLPALVAWLLDRELPFGISFYRENLHSASADALRLDEQRLIDGMRAAYAEIARRPPAWGLLASLLDRSDLSGGHATSCAAGHNYLVIDHHGRVASCQMQIDRPLTTIGVKDPLSLIRSDRRGLQNISVDEKEGCRSCDWRYWCGGGCAVATRRATGRDDLRSPNCRIYQELYPDLIRLEGLRLLRWFGQARDLA